MSPVLWICRPNPFLFSWYIWLTVRISFICRICRDSLHRNAESLTQLFWWNKMSPCSHIICVYINKKFNSQVHTCRNAMLFLCQQHWCLITTTWWYDILSDTYPVIVMLGGIKSWLHYACEYRYKQVPYYFLLSDKKLNIYNDTICRITHTKR